MSKSSSSGLALSRRQLLAVGGGIMAASAVGTAPRQAAASTSEADEWMNKLTGGKAPVEGKITLKLPQIAENGTQVPFSVSVDSPMTEADHVKAVHVISDGNPTPYVASFFFTPRSGKAEASMRMRLAKTQNVRAVAVMSDGTTYVAKQEVKVTIGGCGG